MVDALHTPGRTTTVYSVGEALIRRARLCGLCGGSGNLLSTRYGLSWWTCCCCGGAGVEAMMQPQTFRHPAIAKATATHSTGEA